MFRQILIQFKFYWTSNLSQTLISSASEQLTTLTRTEILSVMQWALFWENWAECMGFNPLHAGKCCLLNF